jgi:multiple antibiotic resistance protein
MMWSVSLLQDFFLAFSALFSIVNPFGGALIFSQVTADRTHGERVRLSRKIAFYAAIVMLTSLWVGIYVLNFFGISIAALRLAGGMVVAATAWQMLSTPEKHEERKENQANEATGSDEIAFFPLTMPVTTGPGTISVAIALGASRPAADAGLLRFVFGTTGAVLAVALLVWVSYLWSDRLQDWLGSSRTRIVARLAAFLLLCIGIQISLTGALDALRSLHS